ncbi:hypothetical protein OG884_15870 [Streptosporangium sp. NBC_01755]|uniref:hypothetical protein n=1 Tax=unclassified Streptosporangium TaxID=2632669 RepID=UPI002DD95F6D|nr:MULTISPECIES: hypothetical protein [unclassified Streptosporangium]WSA25375.1 hypothetical protein OIE13_31365 [Streptosporangium sp. NBC_01810]WSD03309.1 hypothetical protein OG884_15870 [Streptosporangium sp. NBC_01755]
MNYRKPIAVAAAAAVGLVMMVTPAMSATAQAAAPAAKVAVKPADTAGILEVKRASIACFSPRGKKANYSWGTGGVSTTVYFNNHCSHKVPAKLHFKSAIGTTTKRCMITNGNTSGKKRFWVPGFQLQKITKGC